MLPLNSPVLAVSLANQQPCTVAQTMPQNPSQHNAQAITIILYVTALMLKPSLGSGLERST